MIQTKLHFCFISRIFQKSLGLFEIQTTFCCAALPAREKQLFSQEEMLDIRHFEPGHGIMVTLGLGLGSATRVKSVIM